MGSKTDKNKYTTTGSYGDRDYKQINEHFQHAEANEDFHAKTRPHISSGILHPKPDVHEGHVPKGSKVSNIPGGLFVKFPKGHEKEHHGHKEFGVKLDNSATNVAAVLKAIRKSEEDVVVLEATLRDLEDKNDVAEVDVDRVPSGISGQTRKGDTSPLVKRQRTRVEVVKKSSLRKARIDEGKSWNEKVDARDERNTRAVVAPPRYVSAPDTEEGRRKKFFASHAKLEGKPFKEDQRVSNFYGENREDPDTMRRAARRRLAMTRKIKEGSRGKLPKSELASAKSRLDSMRLKKAEDYDTYSDLSNRMRDVGSRIKEAAARGEYHKDHPLYGEAIGLLKEAQGHKRGFYSGGVKESAKRLLGANVKGLGDSEVARKRAGQA